MFFVRTEFFHKGGGDGTESCSSTSSHYGMQERVEREEAQHQTKQQQQQQQHDNYISDFDCARSGISNGRYYDGGDGFRTSLRDCNSSPIAANPTTATATNDDYENKTKFSHHYNESININRNTDDSDESTCLLFGRIDNKHNHNNHNKNKNKNHSGRNPSSCYNQEFEEMKGERDKKSSSAQEAVAESSILTSTSKTAKTTAETAAAATTTTTTILIPTMIQHCSDEIRQEVQQEDQKRSRNEEYYDIAMVSIINDNHNVNDNNNNDNNNNNNNTNWNYSCRNGGTIAVIVANGEQLDQQQLQHNNSSSRRINNNNDDSNENVQNENDHENVHDIRHVETLEETAHDNNDDGNNETDSDDDNDSDNDNDDEDEDVSDTSSFVVDSVVEAERTVVALTRRLRCLFGMVTWPIVPLGTITVLAMLYFVFAAAFLDVPVTVVNGDGGSGDSSSNSSSISRISTTGCFHPMMKVYAFITILVATYAPYHTLIKDRIFHYRRDRDGPNRPIYVRRYDQIIHTLALLYVYAGMTLLESCRENKYDLMPVVEVVDDNDNNNNNGLNDFGIHENPVLGLDVTDFLKYSTSNKTNTMNNSGSGSSGGASPWGMVEDNEADNTNNINTCRATCPNLTAALTIYVATLELFTISLIIPILLVPCIYLWFLRQATTTITNHEALHTVLRNNRQLLTPTIDDDDINDPNSTTTTTTTTTVSVADILSQLETVHLVRRKQQIQNKIGNVCIANNNLKMTSTAAMCQDQEAISRLNEDINDNIRTNGYEIWIVPKHRRQRQLQLQRQLQQHQEGEEDDDEYHDDESLSSTFLGEALNDTSNIEKSNDKNNTYYNSSQNNYNYVAECCICMCEFAIHDDFDDDDDADDDEDEERRRRQPQVVTQRCDDVTNSQSLSDIETGWHHHNYDGDEDQHKTSNAVEAATTVGTGNINKKDDSKKKRARNRTDNDDKDDGIDTIVRTRSCKHLFHKRCIASWVGGRWQPRTTGRRGRHHHHHEHDPDHNLTPVERDNHHHHHHHRSSSSNNDNNKIIRARRTTCPLCRNDLRPKQPQEQSIASATIRTSSRSNRRSTTGSNQHVGEANDDFYSNDNDSGNHASFNHRANEATPTAATVTTTYNTF